MKIVIACLLMLILVMIAACHSEDDNRQYYYTGADTIINTDSGMQQLSTHPAHFGIGNAVTQKQIDAWDIDVRPDGKGLPEGSGTAFAGRNIYLQKCAACHGAKGEGGSAARLVGVMGDTIKTKTIGNYWPYATTLFDYIRRAMPYNAPGSLDNNEVYNLSAFLLYMNKIVDSAAIINAKSLPRVTMPAQKYYVNDDRRGGPEVR